MECYKIASGMEMRCSVPDCIHAVTWNTPRDSTVCDCHYVKENP